GLDAAAATDAQWPHRRRALRRRRHELRADLQGEPGGELCPGRVPAGRRLGLLVAVDGMAAALLGRLPRHPRLHDAVRRDPAGGGAAAADRRAGYQRHHGDDRPRHFLPGADEVDLRRLRQALPADLQHRARQPARARGADGLSDVARHLRADHGGLRLVLHRLEAWPGDAGDGLRPAGGAVPRHLRAEGLRHVLGDLGSGLGGCRRGGGGGERRLLGLVVLWHQGLPRRYPRRARQRHRCGARWADHRRLGELGAVSRCRLVELGQHGDHRALLRPCHHPADQALRAVRHQEHRARL
ncbi:MAG: High-affinity branched-chain amino acid transport system permease protein LivH, partial [uncultured Craurococcus sp.]